MSLDLVGAITSLSDVLDEENAILSGSAYDPRLEPLVSAKLRLVGIIEAEHVRMGTADDGLAALDPPARETLAGLVGAITDKLNVNAGLLQRRIALCDDLMGAITAEAQRASGTRTTTYGARGGLARTQQATPISVNASL